MDAGLRLKNVREKLGLRFRDVERASNAISERRRNADFAVGLSRLADIENKGVVPNIHRLYSLCAIYRLDFEEVLKWYGIPLDEIWRDAAQIQPARTHPLRIGEPRDGVAMLPLQLDPGFDVSKTSFLSRAIQNWGRLPLTLLDSLDIRGYLYALIGAEDFRMHPLLRPGSLVQIDGSRTEIVNSGWAHEFDRPIYFIELRERYVCCWCSLSGDNLILQPHPNSGVAPEIVKYPDDADVLGQVIGIAMQLQDRDAAEPAKKRVRSASIRG